MVDTLMPMAPGFSDRLPPQRPSHLVVFRKPTASNVAMLARSIGSGVRAMAVEGRPGLRSATLSAVSAPLNYYSRFGVASVTLTEAQRRELLMNKEVQGVYANTMRSIPRPVTRPLGKLEVPPAIAAWSQLETPAEAYLAGMIDAASGALRALKMRAPTELHVKAGAGVKRLSWALSAIGIKAATKWTGKGVRVAVLDTGIDRQHPDLASRIVSYRNFAAGSSDNDVVEHGTHCAGVIAGSAKPAGGVRYGVAPQVSLIVGKVLGDDGRGWDDDIVNAMDWAVDEGARVISMSLGAAREVNQPFSALYEDLARNFAETTPGVLIVAAAGNESQRPDRVNPVGNPAACPSIMSVAAVDAQNRVAWFSCSGIDAVGAVDIAAPGVDVVSAKPGGSTQPMDGTSMATPHVAGLAALYLQKSPKLGAAALWKQLQASCLPAGTASDVGSGLVQAP